MVSTPIRTTTTFYISAALNREPKHYQMLEDLGLASETVHKSTFGEAVYQAVMRTSLRNPEATEPVRVIVPDMFCVRFLGRVLGGVDSRPLGPIIAPRKRALTQTERSRRCRLANTKRRLFVLQEFNKTSPLRTFVDFTGQKILARITGWRAINPHTA